MHVEQGHVMVTPPPRVVVATPHRDISRRVASFRFELREDWRPELPPQPTLWARMARLPTTQLQASVVTVAAVRVLRQALPLFQVGGSGGPVPASIRTPLRCGIRPGPGTFLFMGWSHFGEAWLGCAPRFQEFSRARTNHLCPFGVALD
ncbi:Meteorin [Myotis davidii]|uniref:Meteorin n=1 Tax=Myotis davidii TaxID=225400 RepID=L5LQS7_MYODS|nr:Meteorin [Myotis davidii]